MTRKLTGRWYLEKRFFGGFNVIIETVQTKTCKFSFDVSPVFIKWEKAKNEDLLELKINIL